MYNTIEPTEKGKLFFEFINDVEKSWGGKSQLERSKLGLFEETGEIIGKLKKKLRGDKVSDLEIKKEIGDALYYLRIYAKLAKITIVTKKDKRFNSFSAHYFLERFSLNYHYLIRPEKSEKEKDVYFNEILQLFNGLISFLGFDLEEILKINTKKLADRQKRKVIKGSGDNR